MSDEILKKILKKIERIERKIFEENQESEKSTSQNTNMGLDTKNINKKVKIFCETNEIEENKFRYLIDFQENYPRLIKVPKENTRKKIQINSLIILVPLMELIYEKKMNTSIMAEIFKKSFIPTERFDSMYASPLFKKYFSRTGKEINTTWALKRDSITKIKETISN